MALLVSSCHLHNALQPLDLLKAYQLETNGVLEPSGLTEWNGEFYTVSDKQDWIYRLQFHEDSIVLEPYIEIVNNRKTKLDFEGITHDDENFYLISEMYFQILKVSKNGQQQSWMPKNTELKEQGQAAGLFQVRNAYFEGICLIAEDKFLLVAERQPRGFVQVEFNESTRIDSLAYVANESQFIALKNRSPDFTGLSCNDSIYVLERNAYLVTQLKKKAGKFEKKRSWSYHHIIEKDEYIYQDMQYGHAEGLVVKNNKIYILLDNNKNFHANANNNNSLFLVMQFP